MFCLITKKGGTGKNFALTCGIRLSKKKGPAKLFVSKKRFTNFFQKISVNFDYFLDKGMISLYIWLNDTCRIQHPHK